MSCCQFPSGLPSVLSSRKSPSGPLRGSLARLLVPWPQFWVRPRESKGLLKCVLQQCRGSEAGVEQRKCLRLKCLEWTEEGKWSLGLICKETEDVLESISLCNYVVCMRHLPEVVPFVDHKPHSILHTRTHTLIHVPLLLKLWFRIF